jgi:hypothetical protein
MVTLQVGYAKSGRSCCRHCLDEIESGGVRVGVTSDSGSLRKTSYYHCTCLLKTSLSRYCAPHRISGFQSLLKTDQDTILRNWTIITQKESVEPKKEVEVVEVDECAEGVSERARSYLDRLAVREQKPETAPKRSKRKRKGPVLPAGWTGYTLEEYRTYKKHCEQLGFCSIDTLKQECERNLQPVSGNKLDLVERVADGRTLGRAGKCQACSSGLRFIPRSSEFLCIETATCGKRFPSSSIERDSWAK